MRAGSPLPFNASPTQPHGLEWRTSSRRAAGALADGTWRRIRQNPVAHFACGQRSCAVPGTTASTPSSCRWTRPQPSPGRHWALGRVPWVREGRLKRTRRCRNQWPRGQAGVSCSRRPAPQPAIPTILSGSSAPMIHLFRPAVKPNPDAVQCVNGGGYRASSTPTLQRRPPSSRNGGGRPRSPAPASTVWFSLPPPESRLASARMVWPLRIAWRSRLRLSMSRSLDIPVGRIQGPRAVFYGVWRMGRDHVQRQ